MALGRAVVVIALISAPLAAEDAWKPPQGLQDMPIATPADNALTPGRIRLGEQLFFDKRLSKTKAMSCETCHVPEKGWTDGLALSPKFDGSVNTRHSPTLYGVAYYPDLYWDGRAKGLEAQILAAWKGQMGADPDVIAKELEAIAAYKSAFEAELGGPPTGERVVKALASFVRTIHAAPTPWDRMTPTERDKGPAGAGFKVFSEKARCTLCHLPPLFSDTLFHNVGIGYDNEKPDLGRYEITKEEKDKGAFKTPTCRNVALSPPYMHDGSQQTLEEVVEWYAKGGHPNPHLSDKVKKLELTDQDKADLVEFMKALTGEFPHVEVARLPQ